MAKYLFLTSDYLPNLDANGINTKVIINGLQNKGHEVVVLSTKSFASEKAHEVIQNTKIYRVALSKYETKLEQYVDSKLKLNVLKMYRRLLNIINLKKLPNFDLDQTENTYLKATNIIDSEDIDYIIATVRPFSNIDVLSKLVTDYPSKLFGIYYLDLLTGLRRPVFMPKMLYSFLIDTSYSKTLQIVDFALIPESGKVAIKSEILSQYAEKIKFIDYPTFNNFSNDGNIKQKKSGEISLTYAGTLNKNYRNPDFFLKVVKRVHQNIPDIKVNLFGNNDLSEYKSFSKDDIFIKNHGFQSKEIIDSYNISADFLINISNTYSDIVPSKIFELFSTGKPIINFVKTPHDFTLTYFEKYPLSYNYLEWEDYEKQTDELIKFITKNIGKTIETSKLLPLFEKNTPDYTVKTIENSTIFLK